MPEVPVNFLNVLVAGVLNMVVGFVWYSPMLFGNLWMKLSKLTKSDLEKAKKEMPKMYGVSFVAALLMAYVLRHVLVMSGAFYGLEGATTGLMSGFWMWAGFVMPVQLTHWLFEKQPFKLFLIHTGYQLVALLVMGFVLAM